MSGGVPAGFTDNGAPVPLKRVAHTAVHYAAWMAAVVASKRGGATSDHIAECYGFLADECVRGVTPLAPLPKGYDWSAAGAIDTANALLEYDA